MSTRVKASTLAILGILALSIFAMDDLRSIKASPKPKMSFPPSSLLLPTQERVYKLKEDTFPDVVKIVEVRNLQAVDFPLSMEIVVKNLSTKNIYGVSLGIRFPDSVAEDKTIGSLVYYGNKRLTNYENLANPGEDFIAPGKTGIVKMDRDRASAFVKAIKTGKLPLSSTYNVQIIFQTLNFGDGTGYLNKELYPRKISQIQRKLNTKERRLVSQLNIAMVENPALFAIGKSFNMSGGIFDQSVLGELSDGLIDFPLLELMKDRSKSCYTILLYL